MGDEELLSFLQLEGPDVLEWLEKGVEVVRLAERVAVASPPPPPPKRKRATEEDIRASKTYIVRRAAKDKIAQKKALLDSINEFGNILSQYDMPEDERTRLIHELVQELLEEETQSKTIQ